MAAAKARPKRRRLFIILGIVAAVASLSSLGVVGTLLYPRFARFEPGGDTVVQGTRGVQAIAVDDSFLYFARDAPGTDDCILSPCVRQIMRIPLAGGQAELLAKEPADEIHQLLVRGGGLFWVTCRLGNCESHLMRVPTGGGEAQELVRGGQIEMMAAGESGPIYMVFARHDAIWSVPLEGGPKTRVVGELASVVAVDDQRLFWAWKDRLRTAALDGSGPQTLVARLAGPVVGLASDGAHIYALCDGRTQEDSGSIWRVPVQGGEPVNVGWTRPAVQGLYLAGTQVLWLEEHRHPDHGYVWRLMSDDQRGGDVELLVDRIHLAEPGSIAVGSTEVFAARWSDVVRVPRP